MKYVISLLLGLVCGAAVLAAGLYYNPFAGSVTLSPLAISETKMQQLFYSAVPADSIAFTNDGESISQPYPKKISELWEPAIKDTQLQVVHMLDVRGNPAGIGIKISSPSEETRLFNSAMLVNSVWHLYVPGRGTLAIGQTENYWSYVRDIVIPARRNSGDSWRGNWNRNMTIGPGALGTGNVSGLGGEYTGLHGEAVESFNARAYSALQGPVSMTGTLSIVLDSPPALIKETESIQ